MVCLVKGKHGTQLGCKNDSKELNCSENRRNEMRIKLFEAPGAPRPWEDSGSSGTEEINLSSPRNAYTSNPLNSPPIPREHFVDKAFHLKACPSGNNSKTKQNKFPSTSSRRI
jgi:hypothetical protein